jgi:phospholipid/cholesterol/gamma-HCH transport system substrate-binding protein
MRVGNLRTKMLALATFGIVCTALFAYLFTLAGGRFRTHEPYNAKVLVPEPFNIVLNSDVRRDGVTVGRVRKIEPKGRLGEIKFELEKKGQQQLYRDATVRVRTKTLVGESYLDLDPGHLAAGKLPSGSVLPLNAAQESVPLERILNAVDAPTRREIRRNMKGLGVGLAGHGAQLNELFGAMRPTVADGGRLMHVLRPQRRELAALIGNTGAVLQAFGERSAALRSLAQDAKTTAVAVAGRDAQLKQSIEELPATLTRARSSLARLATFSGSATPVVRDLKLAAGDLTPAMRTLEPAARDARSLFRELSPFLRAADPLLDALGPGARSLRTVVAPLDEVLRQANPALRYLDPYRKELGTFFSNVGGLISGYDALGHKARVFPMLGVNDLTSLPPSLRKIADAFVEQGTFGVLKGTRRNPYPKPGTAGDPQAYGGGYDRVEADK